MFKPPIDIAAQTDAQVRALIEQGRGTMPPFSSRLSAAEIDSLIAQLRSWQASSPSAVRDGDCDCGASDRRGRRDAHDGDCDCVAHDGRDRHRGAQHHGRKQRGCMVGELPGMPR